MNQPKCITPLYENQTKLEQTAHKSNTMGHITKNLAENFSYRELPRLKYSVPSRCSNVSCRVRFYNIHLDGIVLQVSCST